MSIILTAALLGSLAATVAGHGRVQGIVAGGIWYEGYDPSFQYENPAPVVIGWSDPEDLSNGFIDPSNYTTPEIVCHLGATPAGTAAKVKAGGKVKLQWTPWPESHHGPVLTYLAKCPASCSYVDKTTLKFFKIDEVGLISDAAPPGIWAADQLEANNNSWVVEIPSSISSGNYVMRHEIIALHSAETENGAQNYPQCINLEITSAGTDNPEGILGEKLYTPDEPGILIDIYTSLSTYQIPGPTLYSGAVSLKQTTIPFSGAAPISSASSGATTSAATIRSTTLSMSSSVTSKTHTAARSKSSKTTIVSAATETAHPRSTKTSAHTAGHTSVVVATTICTMEVTVTATASAKSIIPDRSDVPSSTSTVALIVSAASALPISVLTNTISTLLPTTTGSTGDGHGGNDSLPSVPNMPLPAAFTMKDLLEWVNYLLKQFFSEQHHQRDFHSR